MARPRAFDCLLQLIDPIGNCLGKFTRGESKLDGTSKFLLANCKRGGPLVAFNNEMETRVFEEVEPLRNRNAGEANGEFSCFDRMLSRRFNIAVASARRSCFTRRAAVSAVCLYGRIAVIETLVDEASGSRW